MGATGGAGARAWGMGVLLGAAGTRDATRPAHHTEAKISTDHCSQLCADDISSDHELSTMSFLKLALGFGPDVACFIRSKLQIAIGVSAAVSLDVLTLSERCHLAMSLTCMPVATNCTQS